MDWLCTRSPLSTAVLVGIGGWGGRTSLGLGLVFGLILALTGAGDGGGILAVPRLVFGARVGVSEAGPIGLMALGIAAMLGALLGLRAGLVR